MWSILHHITPLVINSLVGGHTHRHPNRNNTKKPGMPACSWHAPVLKNVMVIALGVYPVAATTYVCKCCEQSSTKFLEGYSLQLLKWLFTTPSNFVHFKSPSSVHFHKRTSKGTCPIVQVYASPYLPRLLCFLSLPSLLYLSSLLYLPSLLNLPSLLYVPSLLYLPNLFCCMPIYPICYA